jgi:hypothetical protein
MTKKKSKKKSPKSPRSSGRRKPWLAVFGPHIESFLAHTILKVPDFQAATSASRLHALFCAHFGCAIPRSLFDAALARTGILFTRGAVISTPPSSPVVEQTSEVPLTPRDLDINARYAPKDPEPAAAEPADDGVRFTNEDAPSDPDSEARKNAELQRLLSPSGLAATTGDPNTPIIIPRPR